MFKEQKEAISKKLRESLRTVSHQIENISNEIKIIKKKEKSLGVEKYITVKQNFQQMGSTVHLSRQKKDWVNLTIDQLRLSS